MSIPREPAPERINTSHTLMLTLHPNKTYCVHNNLKKTVKYKRLLDVEMEHPLVEGAPEVHHLRNPLNPSSCTECINYLGTKVSDMAYVAMTEAMYYRIKAHRRNTLHASALNGCTVADDSSHRMLNIAFIIIKDFIKIEGLTPRTSYTLENIMDCDYQVLAVGTIEKSANWIAMLKRNKLTWRAVKQLCDLYESDDGSCIILRVKEAPASVTAASPRNIHMPTPFQEDPDLLEIVPPPPEDNRYRVRTLNRNYTEETLDEELETLV